MRKSEGAGQMCELNHEPQTSINVKISQGLTWPNLKENRVSLFQRDEKLEEEADLIMTD